MAKPKRVTRAKAIRLKCLDCCCGNTAEVRRCEIKDCALWRYRMGREEKDTMYQEAMANQKEG